MKLLAEVDGGLSPLTKRENQVFALLAEGKSRRAISKKLERSFATVSTHIAHIQDKLDADNSTQAVSIGVVDGFLKLKHALVLLLVFVSTVGAVLPNSAYAGSLLDDDDSQPFTRIRVRGRLRVRGGRLQLRYQTKNQGS